MDLPFGDTPDSACANAFRASDKDEYDVYTIPNFA